MRLEQIRGQRSKTKWMVEAADLSGDYSVSEANRLVEAAGRRSFAHQSSTEVKQRREGEFEPLFPTNPNAMMANDFGFYDMKTNELPRRFESPGVLPSLGDILETVDASPKPLI